MSFFYEQRPSQSELVEAIWKSTDVSDGVYVAPADGCWDLIFTTRDGQTKVLFSGPTTKPTDVLYQSGNTNVGIRFNPAAFMTVVSAHTMQDRVSVLPMTLNGMFVFMEYTFAVPTYESADDLVHALKARGLMNQDRVIHDKLERGVFRMSERSVQRHFRQYTGLSAKMHQQIRQAQHAVELLRNGYDPSTVAQEAGYADQAHLTRSLKRFTGRTPAKIMTTTDPIIIEKRA